MSEPTTGQATALAVQQKREIRTVEDIAPLFDTARFEHYGRIAAVMGDASLIPNALKGESRAETVGNCFMVVSLADRLGGFDPFAVAQCVSVQHGKLMLEGKLVSAAIRHKIGVQLQHYYTGEYGTPEFRVYVSDRPFDEEIIPLLKPKGNYPPGWRIIDGSVGEWATTEKGSVKLAPAWLKQPDIQLIYRGDRVWARVFESGVMLGIYTDDEMEDLEVRRQPRAKAGTAEKLIEARNGGADTGGDGFNAERVAGDAPAREDAVDVEVEETTEKTGEADAGGLTLYGSAVMLAAGHAEAGETYLIADDLELSEKNRVSTWKDGKPHSSVGAAGASGLNVYAEHPPAAGEGDRPTETASAPAAGDTPATSELAGDASTDGAEASASGQSTAEADQTSAASDPAASDDGECLHAWVEDGDGKHVCEECGVDRIEIEPDYLTDLEETEDDIGDDPLPEDPAPSGFLGSLRPMTSWLQIKPAFVAMMKTSDWLSAGEEDQNDVRRMVFAEVERVKADHDDPCDWGEDPTLFMLWTVTQVGHSGAQAIEGTLNALKKAPAWSKLNAEQQGRVEAFGAARIKKLVGK